MCRYHDVCGVDRLVKVDKLIATEPICFFSDDKKPVEFFTETFNLLEEASDIWKLNLQILLKC